MIVECKLTKNAVGNTYSTAQCQCRVKTLSGPFRAERGTVNLQAAVSLSIEVVTAVGLCLF
jgi:hypothetical protein